jgi:predicted Zn-ribbon and HTH transcriptional regulator
MYLNAENSKELAALSLEEIKNIDVGAVEDYFLAGALERVKETEKGLSEKSQILRKRILLSPQVDEMFFYGDIYYEILEDLVPLEGGKELSKWALRAIAYFTKEGLSPNFEIYWHYARGFLYQGRGEVFIRFLQLIQPRASILPHYLAMLIKDMFRLGYAALAADLDTLGQQVYKEDWMPIDPETAILPEPIDIRFGEDFESLLLKTLSPDMLTDDIDKAKFKTLFNLKKILSYLDASDEVKAIDLFLLIPDAIQTIFPLWEKDSESKLKILSTLKRLQQENFEALSVLGDLLTANEAEVFLFPFLGKTCGYHFETLKAMLDDPTLARGIRAYAARALLQVADKAPAHRQEVIQIMRNVIQSGEDVRAEELTTSIVADLLDTDLYELKPAVKEAFQKDKISPIMVGPDSFTGAWELPGLKTPEAASGQILFLTCEHCHFTRNHVCKRVFIDTDTYKVTKSWDSQNVFTDKPYVCSKCGTVDHYQVTTATMISLIPTLFFNDEEEMAHELMDKNIYFIFSNDQAYLSGFTPIEVKHIRQKIISQGMDALTPLEKGEYDRITGRFSQSLKGFRLAHQQAPQNRRAALALAMAEHDFGQREKAADLYTDAMRLKKGEIFSELDDPINQAAMQGLSALKAGESSPYPYPGNKNQKSLLENAEGEQSNKDKKKRNRRRH